MDAAMRIAVCFSRRLPVQHYGGIERVVWDLARALDRAGHDVLMVAGPGTECDFATVIEWNEGEDVRSCIPSDVDVVHYHVHPPEEVDHPFVMTLHGNAPVDTPLSKQTVFISCNHAERHGSKTFVHNGLEWPPSPRLDGVRRDFHFLGKAAWRRKNVKGAIAATLGVPGARLHVLGGNRLNFSMGFRCTLNPRIRFYGMVDDRTKQARMRQSRGLVFPVRWHEPFGLAVIESLHCGCPVFATPWGALAELVPPEVGLLSTSCAELTAAMNESHRWSADACHTYAVEHFSADCMAEGYLGMYERVIRGELLHESKPTATEEINTRLQWGK